MPDNRTHSERSGSGGPDSRCLELADESATARLAAAIAALARPRDVIALSGVLGAGKTTFARHFLRAMGLEEEVPSPTFTLVQTYPVPGCKTQAPEHDRSALAVWHFDLFRIGAPQEVYELGIEDAFAEGISLIEWPEKMASLLPEDYLELHLEYAASPHARLARLTGHGAWRHRLSDLATGDPVADD